LGERRTWSFFWGGGGEEGSLGWENFFHPVSDLVIHFDEILAIAPPVLDIFAKKILWYKTILAQNFLLLFYYIVTYVPSITRFNKGMIKSKELPLSTHSFASILFYLLFKLAKTFRIVQPYSQNIKNVD